MSSYDLERVVSALQRNCWKLSKIPSGGQNLFLCEAIIAEEFLHSYSEIEYLNFASNEFLGCSNTNRVPVLLRKMRQFRTQLLPFMIPFPAIYTKLFEDILSLQESWFKGWAKIRENVFIVYGDMVGFSKSAQKHNFNAAIDILSFRQAFFRAFKDNKGYVEASGGDSILGIFRKGEEAISAAKKVLEINKKFNIGARIGISYGDYLSDEDGRPIIGASINTAVRVADGGSKKGAKAGEPTYKYLNSRKFTRKYKVFNNNTGLNRGIWLPWKAAVKIVGMNADKVNPSREEAKGIIDELNKKLIQNGVIKGMKLFLVSRELKGVNDGLTDDNTVLFFGLLPDR